MNYFFLFLVKNLIKRKLCDQQAFNLTKENSCWFYWKHYMFYKIAYIATNWHNTQPLIGIIHSIKTNVISVASTMPKYSFSVEIKNFSNTVIP